MLREPVTLEGEGPWWVAYPGAYVGDHRDWGTGSRALVIRSYSAWFGSRRVTNPTLAFPVNTRIKLTDRSDINLLIVPPTDVTDFEPGDRVEMDVEWIVVPREADDYYGPNEAFRNHLKQHPRSWKTVHRAAVGNDLEVTVTGGKLHHRYPVIVEALAAEVAVDIKGGVGYVPMRFEGLPSADGYVLYEAVDSTLVPLDQSEHGRDFWQTDSDPNTGSLSMTFNVLLDGKPSSRWVLKRPPHDG